MPLSDKFTEFQRWTFARRTAILYRFAVPVSLVVLVGSHFAFRGSGVVDMAIWDRALLLAFGVTISTLVVAEVAVRTGREGRWTIYLAIATFGTCLFVLFHVLGQWHVAYLGWFPLLVVLTAIWYDEWAALAAFGFGAALMALGTVMTMTGVWDYAPAVLDRDIDDQLSWHWVAGIGTIYLSSVCFCLLLSILVTRTLRVQDRQLQKAFAMIRRYVPEQVADALLEDTSQPAGDYERRRLTIFFSDLVGFTDTSDELEPEDLARLLNEYFSEMTRIAHEHRGTVDELSGDAILVFFGAPSATNDRDHALRAVRMAVEMQHRVDELNAAWLAEGRADSVSVRMGINTGVVTVGNFGSPERMKYAALGRHVNIAARLQALCPPGQVVISHTTWLLVKDEFDCTAQGESMLKGLHTPVRHYQVEGCPESVQPEAGSRRPAPR